MSQQPSGHAPIALILFWTALAAPTCSCASADSARSIEQERWKDLGNRVLQDGRTKLHWTQDDNGVEAVGSSALKITGELSVRDVTRSVFLDARINKISTDSNNKVTAGFDADMTLRRSDFGVGRYVPMVSDEIAVHVTVEAGQE
jgi:hypothetical protein